MKQIIIAPGERMDVVVDFGAVVAVNGKKQVFVVNSGAAPFPLGAPTVPNTPGAGTVMQFDVKLAMDAATGAVGMPPAGKTRVTTLKNNLTLRGLDALTPKLVARPPVPAGTKVRRVLLAEGVDDYGRIMPLLGSFQMQGDPDYVNYPGQRNLGTLGFSQLPTETPKLGTTEVWEFWNNTVDAHPIHMHLVRFRLLNREAYGPSASAPIDSNGAPAMAEVKAMVNGWTGERLIPAHVQLSGLPVAAPAGEQGWKDTILCYPGEVTRILVKFERRGKYVYHCHILSHEEHDMMRWYSVS
jgi:spore coat protein A